MKRILLLTAVILLMACTTAAEVSRSAPDIAEASSGIVYTTIYKSTTEIEWLDDDHNAIGTSRYRFPGALMSGYRNMCSVDDRVYIVPDAATDDFNYGKIVRIDLNSGETSYYNYGRVNPTGWCAEGDLIALCSNLNAEYYVDVIDTGSRTIRSVKCPENIRIMELVICDGEIYGLADDEDYHVFLCRCDMEHSEIVPVSDIPGRLIPSFPQTYQGRIYYTAKDRLYRYDPASGKTKEWHLPYDRAFNLNIVGDVLWIGYTDIFDSETVSYVEARRAADGEALTSFSLKGDVHQIEGNGKELLIYANTRVEFYDSAGVSEGRRPVLKKCIPYDPGDLFRGGCILREGGDYSDQKKPHEADGREKEPDRPVSCIRDTADGPADPQRIRPDRLRALHVRGGDDGGEPEADRAGRSDAGGTG